MADLIEVGLLREILTNEDVGIFVETPFPSAVRMREVGLAVQDLINSGVSGKLFSIIESEGVELVTILD